MGITVTENTTNIAIAETGDSLSVAAGAAATIDVEPNTSPITVANPTQPVTVAPNANTVTVAPGVIANPTEVSGTASGVIAVNDLVFQDEDTVYLADQSNPDRPALGIVTRVSGSTVYHTPIKAANSITVAGIADSGHKTLYLGTAGGTTFIPPAWLSGLLSQQVGFATHDNGDTTHDALINCTAPGATA